MKSEYEAAGYNMLGLKLKSPVIVGSGLISDQAKNIRQLLMCGAGAVVTKTIYPLSVKTHTERVYPIGTGLLNNTHYSKRTVDNWLDLLGQFHQQQLPIIASVHAPSPVRQDCLWRPFVISATALWSWGYLACMQMILLRTTLSESMPMPMQPSAD